MRDFEQNFIPNLSQNIERGATKLCVYKMADVVLREHAKHVLKTRFYSNYFSSDSGANSQGGKKFTPCTQFKILQILNDCSGVHVTDLTK